MTEGAAVVRSRRSLTAAGAAIDAIGAETAGSPVTSRALGELSNLATAAAGLLRSAAVRRETRGAHVRSDYPETSERWRRRIVHSKDGIAVCDASAGEDGGT